MALCIVTTRFARWAFGEPAVHYRAFFWFYF
jgi:hypothetical protein